MVLSRIGAKHGRWARSTTDSQRDKTEGGILRADWPSIKVKLEGKSSEDGGVLMERLTLGFAKFPI